MLLEKRRYLLAISACAIMASASQRLASAVRMSSKQREGGGFIVRRPALGSAGHVGGTFLMLDHMGPVTYGPGEAVGAPDHPHRGFETVTYVLQGTLQHKDSAGNSGNLGPGWVQWMTAGSGVVHSEMPSEDMRVRGGTIEGFQLWVNLPKKDKMTPPRYQDTPAERIPVAQVQGARHEATRVKIIAGEYAGTLAVIDTHTPMGYLDVRVGPGDSVSQPIPDGHAGFVYVYRGRAELGARRVSASEGGFATIEGTTGEFRIACAADASEPASALLIYGQPIPDPIARYGPFVMNTQSELEQAYEDYQAGRLGRIEGASERYAATEAARAAQKASGAWGKEL